MARPNKPAPAAGNLETELAGLETTQANLQARQTALATEIEAAIARRRDLLISGSDAAGLAEAERTCRELEGTAFGIADALAEVERRIVATCDRIEAARIAAEREAAAASLERDGKAIDAAAERVRLIVADLAKAQAALAAAITPTASPHFAKRDRHGRRDGEAPEHLAAYFVGHMVATALPDLDVSEAGRQLRFGWLDPRPIEATDGEVPAKVLLTDPMRAAAAGVRAGEASPDLPRFHRTEPDFTPAVPEVQVYVIEPFRYGTGEGRTPEIVTSVVQSIPAPVAERAIAEGFASEAEPKNLADIKARRSHAIEGVNIFSFPDLGFDLADWKAEEIARRRAVWLAEQQLRAA